MFKVPNQYRVKIGNMASEDTIGLCGAFKIPFLFDQKTGAKTRQYYLCVASDGGDITDWEHVSVQVIIGTKLQIPRWSDMCYIKTMFWDEEDTVVQFHPKKSKYKNDAPNVLHLWRRIGKEHELPPNLLV